MGLSERTLNRWRAEGDQVTTDKRLEATPVGRTQPRRTVPEPTNFTATGPNQVYTWDISYCPSAVKGQHWYLYLILDLYSRQLDN